MSFTVSSDEEMSTITPELIERADPRAVADSKSPTSIERSCKPAHFGESADVSRLAVSVQGYVKVAPIRKRLADAHFLARWVHWF